jgi:hypothetical protein
VSERVEGEWRCAGCGDGEKVYGCAEAIVFGRLDGPESVTEDDTEQIGICSGSVECSVHQNTEPLERWDGERWVQWEPCVPCDGRGSETNPRSVFGPKITCRTCGGRGGQWPGLSTNPHGSH